MRIYMRRLQDERNDRGFTLIELLVVIIIIGILAAIAIPVFLDQRQKGYDASAKSDLRNLANFEEIYLDDFETYGDANSLITKEPLMEVSAHDHLAIYFNGADAYCLEATYDGSPHTWTYDSGLGGLQPLAAPTCTVTHPTWTGPSTL